MAFSFSNPSLAPEEKKGVFGDGFKTEAKMFVNQNLFNNPMVTGSKPYLTGSKPRIKREDPEDHGVTNIVL